MFCMTTPLGTDMSRERYRTIRLYFLEVLQVAYHTAGREARELGKVLSDASLTAMRQAVDRCGDWAELAALIPA